MRAGPPPPNAVLCSHGRSVSELCDDCDDRFVEIADAEHGFQAWLRPSHVAMVTHFTSTVVRLETSNGRAFFVGGTVEEWLEKLGGVQ